MELGAPLIIDEKAWAFTPDFEVVLSNDRCNLKARSSKDPSVWFLEKIFTRPLTDSEILLEIETIKKQFL